MKRNIWIDDLILGEIVMIGLAEAAHLTTILCNWTFRQCVTCFWGAVGGICVLLAAWLVFKCLGVAKGGKKQKIRENQEWILPGNGAEWILLMVFGLLLLSQLLFIWMGQGPELNGDMTVETVESFLEADYIYKLNPMTGQPYTAGIPSRLKILCLPTFYGSLCKIFDLSPRVVVWIIVPTVTLLSSYAAFYALACSLFPVTVDTTSMSGGQDTSNVASMSGGKGTSNASVRPNDKGISNASAITDGGRTSKSGGAIKFFHRGNGYGTENSVGKKRLCFLIVVSLLLWAGTYFHTMDGFQLLYCGWQGPAIRNGVLLPWLVSLCIRRKWLSAVMCVLAEACMVWTLYGMGVCLIVFVGMAAADRGTRERPRTLSDSFWEADREECTK